MEETVQNRDRGGVIMDTVTATAVAKFIKAHPSLLDREVVQVIEEGVRSYLLLGGKDMERRRAIFVDLLSSVNDRVGNFSLPEPFSKTLCLATLFIETLAYVLPRWVAIRDRGIKRGVYVRSKNGRQVGKVIRIYPNGRLLVLKEGQVLFTANKSTAPFICDPREIEVFKSPE